MSIFKIRYQWNSTNQSRAEEAPDVRDPSLTLCITDIVAICAASIIILFRLHNPFGSTLLASIRQAPSVVTDICSIFADSVVEFTSYFPARHFATAVVWSAL